MSSERYDVVVIGAGIHGAGVAQAAAAAGYDVLVLEKHHPASGTSSRSSKLIHGGLRYLETGQFGLVRESLNERTVLLRIAPTLVHLIPFLVPIYRTTRRRPWQIRVGLGLYWLLGGMRRDMRFDAVPRETWGTLDGLRTDGLQTVLRYHDAQTDDAVLTRAVLRSAESLGARVACPATFGGAHRVADGYDVVYRTDEGDRTCRGRVVVNAAGAWANEILEGVDPKPPRLAVELVQGTHIVVEGEVEHGVYYTEAPSDGRAVFIMPWHGATLVGTTETPYRGRPEDVRPLPAEIDYLRDTLRHYFPGRSTKVVESFAGLRVLPRSVAAAFRRPREVLISTDDRAAPRLATVAGGKLTAYRATAEKVLHAVRRSLPEKPSRADTARLPLDPDRDQPPVASASSSASRHRR